MLDVSFHLHRIKTASETPQPSWDSKKMYSKIFLIVYLCMKRAVHLCYNVSNVRAHKILFITVICAAMLRCKQSIKI